MPRRRQPAPQRCLLPVWRRRAAPRETAILRRVPEVASILKPRAARREPAGSTSVTPKRTPRRPAASCCAPRPRIPTTRRRVRLPGAHRRARLRPAPRRAAQRLLPRRDQTARLPPLPAVLEQPLAGAQPRVSRLLLRPGWRPHGLSPDAPGDRARSSTSRWSQELDRVESKVIRRRLPIRMSLAR